MDQSREAMDLLAGDYSSQEKHFNEADTRLKLIDRLLLECLGWQHSDIEAEHQHDGQYADYVLSTAARRVAVIEAKREGSHFELPVPSASTPKREYSLKTLMTGNEPLRSALKQVSEYCSSRGIPVGAVCNGHQLVAFLAVRVDGTPPMDGAAVVFWSLQDMADHFTEFWNLFSRSGIEVDNVSHRLHRTVPSVPPRLSSSIPGYPGVKGRNPFQSDLQSISEAVIEDVADDQELEFAFLKECYCASGVLSQNSLLSKRMLEARYIALENAGSTGISLESVAGKRGKQAVPRLLSTGVGSRPILLVGDVGAGKTTFIRHLIRIDAAELLEKAIVLRVDFGSRATLAEDIRDFIPREIKRQLLEEYGVDVDEKGFVRAVYHGELERFSSGVYGDLREHDPAEYKRQQIGMLQVMLLQHDEHVRRSLQHIVKGRRQQVVVFLDNVDQRSGADQQQAFLAAQEIARHWPSTVFLALRPPTFFRSVREGALSGYAPKVFTIAPPRIVDVIQKRLRFARRLVSREIEFAHLPLEGSTSMEALDSVIKAFLDTIHSPRGRELAEFIDNMAGGNVRLALGLVRSFFGSGHVDTAKIADIVDRTGRYAVPIHEFLRAVLYGDAAYYDPSRSTIANLFDVSSNRKGEHLLQPILISELHSLAVGGGKDGTVAVDVLMQRMQGAGYAPVQVDWAIRKCLSARLIERSGATDLDEVPDSLRVTSIGLYHVSRLIRMFQYVDAMVIDTPISNIQARTRLKNVLGIHDRLDRAEVFLEYINGCWDEAHIQTKGLAFDWPAVLGEVSAEIRQIRARKQ